MTYTVAGGAGKRRVKFACTRCSAGLESPLEEAGRRFPCPTCGAEFVTPGDAELQQQQSQAERAARDKAVAKVQQQQKADAQYAEDVRRARVIDAEYERQKASARAAVVSAQPPVRRDRGFTLATVVGLLVLFAVYDLVVVRPIRDQLKETQAVLDRLTGTVNYNADTANRNNRGY